MAVFRVLQVFTIMNRGGAESMIMNYYRKIDRSKVQFDFLVFRKEKAVFDEEIQELGGRLYKLNAINPFFPKNAYEELRSFFKEHNQYTVIHSHLNTFSCFPLKIAKEFGVPRRIAHAHIAMTKLDVKSILTLEEGVGGTLKKIIKLQLRKRIHKYTTHYFSCGEKAGNWLFGEKTKQVLMNNAIDVEKFKFNRAIAKDYREKFNITNELIIGHVGRFDNQKNHTFLLEIFAAILEAAPNCKLYLIGDGPLKSKIERQAENLSIKGKIEFLGVRTDIPELSQMMDVFLFPSLYEGLPVTLVEAQAAGLRVFAADTITKEVRLSNLIEFIPLDKPAAYWAKKILETNPSERKDIKDEIIDNGYDIVSNSLRIQNFYLQQKHS